MIEIRPEVAIYSAFARLNYKPWYALGEFVDNSIQNYLANSFRLRMVDGDAHRLLVNIEISDDEIVIRDNAAGIAANEFPRAFLPASPPPDRSGLSEYGLGMKAAACWFANAWSVRTKALGDQVERTIRFNIPQIVENKQNQLPVEENPAPTDAHYTVLTLTDLRIQPKGRTLGKIADHLASIYRIFLRENELTLSFRGEQLAYTPPGLMEAPRFDRPDSDPLFWKKTFRLELDNEHSVSGWAGLLATASVSNAGFAVFRRRRLIEGSVGEAYRPEKIFRRSNSYTHQRLVGELQVEGFTVSHTKDGVQWSDWEDDILDWLKTELDAEPLPLLKQAEGHRVRAPTPVTAVRSATEDLAEALVQRLPAIIDSQLQMTPDSMPPPPALVAAQIQHYVEETINLSHAGTSWCVSVELANGSPHEPWLDIARSREHEGTMELQIRVNLSHPFMVRFTGPDASELIPMTRMATGLAVAEETARSAGVSQCRTIRRNLDEILRGALSGPVVASDMASDN